MELIKVDFDTQMVSARDLYESVGSTERFSNWFNRQLQFGFVENEDYVGRKTFNTLARQELQDYQLTLDMAKQICMVQKNEKARAIRQYLIDLEKAWNTPEQVMARALKIANQTIDSLHEKVAELQQDNERMKPKEIFADAVETSRTSILIGDLAKLICQNGYSIGQNRLFEWLRANGYLLSNGASKNMPAQRYMDSGYFEVKERVISNPDGSTRITKTTKVTGKGQIYFVNKFMGIKNGSTNTKPKVATAH
jgi:anti-repressor protein